MEGQLKATGHSTGGPLVSGKWTPVSLRVGYRSLSPLSSEVSTVPPEEVNRVEPGKNVHYIPNQNRITLAERWIQGFEL